MNSKLTRKYNELAEMVLRNFDRKHKNENIVFSPDSVMILLAIAAEATSGKTKEEILKVIDYDDSNNQVADSISEIQRNIEDGKILRSANAVIANRSLSEFIRDEFKGNLKKRFDGEVISSGNIVDDVNAWVSRKTDGMLSKIADESMKEMVACIINAMVFSADWENTYEEDNIFRDIFRNSDSTESEVTMLDSIEDSYIENKSYTGFVKPYKSGYSFVALLPKEKYGEGIPAAVQDHIDFTKLFNGRKHFKTIVAMPEFSAEFSEDIKELYMEMGINEMFTPDADFSTMSRKNMYVNKIIHKSKIEVGRRGTKAAAASMAGMYVTGIHNFTDVKRIVINRPFIYAVIHNKTGLPVFAGTVNKL